MSIVKVLLVEDHIVVRQALVRALKPGKRAYQLYEASNGEEALHILLKENIDIILLDLQMPIKNGIETLMEIRKTDTKTKIVILSMHSDSPLVLHALKLGANGFLTKDIDLDTLEAAIDKALNGDYMQNGVTPSVIEEFTRHPQDFPNLNLSPREFQLLELIKLGLTNKDIARHLRLQLMTVESYRKSLMKKTKCANIAELVSFAHKIGLNLPSDMLDVRPKQKE